MNSFADSNLPKRDVNIISTSEVEKHTVYTIQVTVEDSQWTVQHRYSEFHDLHDKLVALGKVARSQLPPKRFIGNLSKSFVEKRQRDLETYLQGIVISNKILPKPLLLFLEFDIYDINGVSQALAAELFEKGDLILASQDVCEMTPMQLFAITERLKLPLPTCDSEDAHNDIGHIMDFMSRLKYLRIVGSSARLGSSSRKVDELPFDLSYFKQIRHLQVDVCNAKKIAGIEEIKRHVQFIAVHRTLKTCEDILLPNRAQWEALAGSNGQDVLKVVPPWNEVKLADFSHNELIAIDTSVCLLPHVEQLDLSHNQLRGVDHLQHLSAMTHLNLSHNQVTCLEGLHTRLGNVHTLLLSTNQLSSLQGLARLYSLVKLDVRSNVIEHVVEVQHVCNLPCLEHLLLSLNPVTTVVDYRTKVLELFDERFTELNLDGQKATEKEKDTVNILKAIKRSKDYRPFVGSKHNSPKKVVHEASIVDPSSSAKASNPQSFTSNLAGDDPEFKAKVESLRAQGGKAWLSILNEMSDPAECGATAAMTTKGEGQKSKDKGHKKEKTKRARSRSPQPKTLSTTNKPRPLQQVKLTPKAFAYHVLDEVSRHGHAGITSIPSIFSNLTIYFQGPKLFTYGPRHQVAGKPPPTVNGPTLEKYLNLMCAEDQDEFVGILQGTLDGSVQLSKTFPSRAEAEDVWRHVLHLLGRSDEMEEKQEEEIASQNEADPVASNLCIRYSPDSDVNNSEERREENTQGSKCETATVDTLTSGVGIEGAALVTGVGIRVEDLTISVADREQVQEEKEVESIANQSAASIEHVIPPKEPVISDNQNKEYGRVIPELKQQVSTHAIIPDYDQESIDHIASCKHRKELSLTATMQYLATMSANELIKYFHENVSQIGIDFEYLCHVVWSNVIAYAAPSEEIVSCVMLSTRALYVLSDKNLRFHREAWKTHRRNCSDSAVRKSRLTSGRPDGQSHASGVIHSSTDMAENRIRCQHVIPLRDIDEVVVGLFDQKIRLTGQCPDNTMTLITRNFKETHDFQQQLMLALPHPQSPHKSDKRPSSPIDLYKEAMKARQEAVITEYRHPGGVKFTYANEETISDLTYLVVEKLKNPSMGHRDAHLLMYMLLHQIGDIISNNDSVPPSVQSAPRTPRSLIITNTHAALCHEDHVCYPIPNFSKLLPESPQYSISDVQPIFNLKRLVVSDFSSCDITLIFEVIHVEVDISREYFTSSDQQGGEKQHTPDVVWTLMLPSLEDRERLLKMLCGQWRDAHNKELSIQVSA